MADHLNDQVTESVAYAHLLTIGQAGAQSMAVIEAVGAETIGASMHNAVTAQANAQMLTSAAITATCARILSAQPAPTAAPAPPPKRAPARPGGTGGSGGSPIQNVVAAQRAVDRLADDASRAESASELSRSHLRSLAAEAAAAANPQPVDDDTPGSDERDSSSASDSGGAS